MGQKVNPTGFRTGIMEGWKSRWYASKKDFSDLLVEDFKIRRFIKTKFRYAGIPKIEIERTRDEVKVVLLREGQNVELTVDSELITDYQNTGGRLEPMSRDQ